MSNSLILNRKRKWEEKRMTRILDEIQKEDIHIEKSTKGIYGFNFGRLIVFFTKSANCP